MVFFGNFTYEIANSNGMEAVAHTLNIARKKASRQTRHVVLNLLVGLSRWVDQQTNNYNFVFIDNAFYANFKQSAVWMFSYLHFFNETKKHTQWMMQNAIRKLVLGARRNATFWFLFHTGT